MKQSLSVQCRWMFFMAAPWLSLSSIQSSLHAQTRQVQESPVLRIEAGMHTAPINSISTHSAGHLVLTVSDDKTARLWPLEPGGGTAGVPPRNATPLRVLRPPIGEGREGQLYCGALSPDGSLAAIAGFTPALAGGSDCVYLFDTLTGHLLKRLDGLTNLALTLDFSKSGRWLAAGLAGKEGIRVWDVSSGVLLGADSNYGDSCHGVDWRGDETLATSSLDGLVRTYPVAGLSVKTSPAALNPSARAARNSPLDPMSVKFSPDGTTLGVGFADRPHILALDATTLNVKIEQGFDDGLGVRKGGLGNVAWSTDGHWLAAGGSHTFAGDERAFISLWGNRGSGARREFPAAFNSVLDITATPNGEFLFSAADPSWGRLGIEEGARVLGKSPLADFRKMTEGGFGLALSLDGAEVNFSYESANLSPAHFSVSKRLLDPLRLNPLLSPPLTTGLAVSDWKSHHSPKLNDVPLSLHDHESSNCLAIAEDRSLFVLGTSLGLRAFDPEGLERWNTSTPSEIWAVNLSRDGRLATAACADGTIRWHRVADGREVLAFYPHPDRGRWVLWATDHEPVVTSIPHSGLATHSSGAYLVEQGSAAWKAGIRSGDRPAEVITQSFVDDLQIIGKEVRLEIYRDGQRQAFNFVVEPRIDLKARAVYYDASPGAEEFLGWHINRGKDQASDFFPISRFRSVFYRPDVVSQVLKTLDAGKALEAANATRGLPPSQSASIAEVIRRLSPPVVELDTGGITRQVSLPAGTNQFTLRYRVRDTGDAPATRVEIRLNGRPLLVDAPVPAPGESQETTVEIPEGMEGTVAVIASHGLAASEAALLRIVRDKAAPLPLDGPDLHLLVVGVSKLKLNEGLDTDGNGDISTTEYLARYPRDSVLLGDLRGARNDAERLHRLLTRQEGRAFKKVHATALLDSAATTEAMRSRLQDLAIHAKPRDVVIVFFAGHGYADAKREFLLATHDFDPGRAVETGLTGRELGLLLEPIRARVVLCLDTCQSGGVFAGSQEPAAVTSPADLTRLINTLSDAERGIVVMSSSSSTEFSFESGEGEEAGGYFTTALAEALEGRAETTAGAVNCEAAGRYVTRRVPEMLREHWDSLNEDERAEQGNDPGSQTPGVVLPNGVPDFPLAKPE